MEEASLPVGFRFAGIHAGIKPDKHDLSLVVADQACVAAGVYTQNLVRAACIDWNRAITPTDGLRGVIVNSGNANACTGVQGVRDNRELAALLAGRLSDADRSPVRAEQILVLSTGVIGRPMPMQVLREGVPAACQRLGTTRADFEAAATGIMTTDHHRKTVMESWEWEGERFSIAAMAKGAGMIGPAMATMLAIIATDFPLSPQQADTFLREAVAGSFNRISVEGHTSTNDSCLLLARPQAGAAGQPEGSLREFRSRLAAATLQLAKQIPADGEGATHLIRIEVSGAVDEAGADRIARTIALSNLVKTAIAGADPNWGRIVSAAGYAGVPFEVHQTSLEINGLLLFRDGEPVAFDAKTVSRAIREPFETLIQLQVGSGPGKASHYTSDLTADYVRLNADYTT